MTFSMRKLVLAAALLLFAATAHAETLTNIDKIALDLGFQARVRAALVQVGNQVFVESPPPANHACRVALATKVLHRDFALDIISEGLLYALPGTSVPNYSQASPGYGVSDPDIVSTISGEWNALGGC